MEDDAPISDSPFGYPETPPPDAQSVESPPPSETAPEIIATTPCWRCGKPVPATLQQCPVCRAAARHNLPEIADDASLSAEARLQANAPRIASRRQTSTATTPIVQLIWYFVAMLVMSVIEGGIARGVLNDESDPIKIAETVRSLIVGFEVAMAILVLWALFRIPRPPALPTKSAVQRTRGWLLAILMLAAALVINVGYHSLLLNYLRMPEWLLEDEMYHGATLVWLALAICVQPAIFEELFFRYLALGHLRTEMRDHTAVWVSSMMFALAHLGVPLSMPALFVVGVALGYARVWSGSLLLPMLMHAAHNAMVVFLEMQ